MILTNQSNQARRRHQERCTWGHCFAYIYFKQENKPFLVKSARALKRYENFSINFVLTISSASWAWKTSPFQFSWLNCGSNVCNYQWFNVFSGEITIIIIHSTHYLFSDWPKAYSEFSKSALRTSSSRRLYNNHVKDTEGPWFLRVITSSSRVLCCLLICIFLHVKK